MHVLQTNLENSYLILGVSQSATDAELKAAYRKLAKKYHPDVNKKESGKFLEVKKAYDLILKHRNQPLQFYKDIIKKQQNKQNQPPKHRDPRYRPRKKPFTKEELRKYETRKLRSRYQNSVLFFYFMLFLEICVGFLLISMYGLVVYGYVYNLFLIDYNHLFITLLLIPIGLSGVYMLYRSFMRWKVFNRGI